tara:strand:- start:3570 stop:5567 length:1998 start_codon:yes stop_codon:yes gene_type:complete
VPDDLRDSVQYENFLKDLITRAGNKIRANQKARDDYRKTNPNGTITKSQHMKNIIDKGGDPSHLMKTDYNSYEPQGDVVEANSEQMKAMNDAKMKKKEDDKVKEKNKMKNEGTDHSKKSPYDSSHPGGSVLGQVTKKARKLTLSKKKKDQKRGRDLDKIGTKLTLSKTSKIKPSMKEGVQSEGKKSCGEGEYYCHDRKKCMPIPKGAKVGKGGMLVKEDDMKGMSVKSGHKRSTESGAGMTAKGVAAYRRRNPGSKLKTAVTGKVKRGSKAAKRRKAFCDRSKSWTGPRGKAARRRWRCNNSYENELPMIIDEKKLYNGSPLSDRVAAWARKINEGLTPGRNEMGLPNLKSVEKKINKTKTGRMNTGGDGTAYRGDSYIPQGDMIERTMTSPEKKKKEDYVKGMKKDKKGFTKRYGKDGESVMYATATKMAMKEAKDEKKKSVKGIAKELDKAVAMHKSQAKRLRSAGVSEDFYQKRYAGVGKGYKTVGKNKRMDKSNKRSGDSKKQHRELHKDLAKIKEGNLHSWFKDSKSKDGKSGWVNVVTGGTCASDKKGEGTPKCVSSSKRASMTKAERLSASRRKKKADPNQQSKSGAAKPTYVATDKKKKTNESLTALSAVGLTMAGLQKRKNDQLNYKPGTGRKVDTAGTIANILRNKGKLVTRPDN